MKKLQRLVLLGLFATSGSALSMDNQKNITGYVDGAQVITINEAKQRDQIDNISDVVYSQIKNTRSMKQLHLSVLVPRNNDLKPAIIYFPSGGFTSAQRDQFLEMRIALAERRQTH